MGLTKQRNRNSPTRRTIWILRLLSAAFMACQAVAAVASQSVDLSGPWLMKDYALGVGVQKQLQVPGRLPMNCLPVQVPGTVRGALLDAGQIPDPIG